MVIGINRPLEIASILNLLTGKTETENLQDPPIIDLNNQEMQALEAQADHDCSKYLTSKYDKTNHWDECSECGTKYNVTAHTFTETWTMGDSCSPSNKCNHVCNCGYSYQSGNTREHDLSEMLTNVLDYKHYQKCKICNTSVNVASCTKEDGSIINCDNLGTCNVCGTVCSKVSHWGICTKIGDVTCSHCKKYVGTVKNLETKQEDNIFKFSYDFSVSDTGNFKNATLSIWKNSIDSLIIQSHIKEEKDSTTIHVTGEIDYSTYSLETPFRIDSYIKNYNVSADENVPNFYVMMYNISPDIDPPVINTDIEQTDLATSNGWATQKRITVTGTENFCKTVKLSLKDDEGNTYLNNAAVNVTDNNWSYTFTPDIEADETGKEFTIVATDNLGNSSEQKFMVYKTDKKAPTMTSPSESSKDWTTEKEFTFTATDSGSGGVQISIGDANHYTLATKSNGVYSKPHTFTEEIYGSKDVTVYFKDGLGNAKSEVVKIYNIDTTAPTITNHEIVNKEIVITGNDKNTTLNKEGSGIAEYRYLGSSKENITLGTVGSTIARPTNRTTSIPLTEFERVKYAYIQAVDGAENTSETIKITLPTYGLTVNPNGGEWRENTESTTLSGYLNAQSITIEDPEREGYNFKNWTVSAGTITGESYTFTVENATLTANWEPKTDTVYTIKHWQENLNNNNPDNYTLIQTETLHGTTDATITPPVKTYAGFTAPQEQQITILADGTAEINYYYTRNSYELTLEKGTGISDVTINLNNNNPDVVGAGLALPAETNTYKYGQTITINADVKEGYTWNKWIVGTDEITEKTHTFEMPAENITLTANAEPKTDTLYTVKHWQEKSNANGTTQNETNYTLIDTETLYGTTDTTVTPSVKTYTGFTSPETQTATILGNGTLEVNYYYTRIRESKVIVHHYIYDIENKKETTSKLTQDEEITGIIGENYTTRKSSRIPNNYEVINERPTGYTGKITLEPIEVSYYYKLKETIIENNTESKIITEIPKDENGNYVIKEGEGIKYVVEYETKMEDYIGNGKIEITAKLPEGVDPEKSDLKGGTYDPITNTVTWIVDVEDIDTFENGEYINKIEKELTLVFKEDKTIENLEEIEIKIEGNMETYYPDDYLDKGGQVSENTKDPEKTGTIVVHHYIYDIENKKETTSKLIQDEEITGIIGEDYTTRKSSKIPKNYEVINERPTGYTGKITLEPIEVSYYYKLKETIIENNTESKIITEIPKDENGNYVIKEGEGIKYVVEYETKIEDYMGNGKIEITAKLPEGVDPEKSDLKGGIYDPITNTVTWIVDVEDIDTFENGEYINKIEKELTLVFKEDKTIENLEEIEIKVDGKMETYYPDDYLDKGGQVSENIKDPEERTGTIIVKYVDIDTNMEITPVGAISNRPQNETYTYEITGKIGEDYETEKKEIPHYKYIKDSGNTKGKITEQETVIYYYAKEITITLKYIDKDTGREIKDRKAYTYYSGDIYNFEKEIETIKKYSYVGTNISLKGKAETKDIDIEIYYETDKTILDVVIPQTGEPMIILPIIIVLAINIATFIRYKKSNKRTP